MLAIGSLQRTPATSKHQDLQPCSLFSEGVGLDPITGWLPAALAARQRPSRSESRGPSLINDKYEMRFRSRPRSSRQSGKQSQGNRFRNFCWEATAAKARAPANSQTAGTEHMRTTYERKTKPGAEQTAEQNRHGRAGGGGREGRWGRERRLPGSMAHWSATPTSFGEMKVKRRQTTHCVRACVCVSVCALARSLAR